MHQFNRTLAVGLSALLFLSSCAGISNVNAKSHHHLKNRTTLVRNRRSHRKSRAKNVLPKGLWHRGKTAYSFSQHVINKYSRNSKRKNSYNIENMANCRVYRYHHGYRIVAKAKNFHRKYNYEPNPSEMYSNKYSKGYIHVYVHGNKLRSNIANPGKKIYKTYYRIYHARVALFA